MVTDMEGDDAGMTIDHDTDVPVYVQLAAILRHMIDSGQIPARRAIPSKRYLTEQHGVAPGTVEHALQLLKADGYLKTVLGRGLFVVPTADRTPPGKRS